jgi:hypothetical protein
MCKITWGNIGVSPIARILAVIMVVVPATYFISKDYLIAEQYKIEIERLEKIIDQRDEIRNLDSIANSLRTILLQQTKLVEKRQSSINHDSLKPKNSGRNWSSQVDKAIETGNALLKSDPSSYNTFDAFNSWREKCLSLLNQIDLELKTNYQNNFATLTRLNMSDYPQLSTKVTDGLSIIKTIRLYY